MRHGFIALLSCTGSESFSFEFADGALVLGSASFGLFFLTDGSSVEESLYNVGL